MLEVCAGPEEFTTGLLLNVETHKLFSASTSICLTVLGKINGIFCISFPFLSYLPMKLQRVLVYDMYTLSSLSTSMLDGSTLSSPAKPLRDK